MQNFGRERARRFVQDAGHEFVDMAREEGEHAKLWQEDARIFGIADLGTLANAHRLAPSVQELVTRSGSPDGIIRLTLLSTTEGAAEALSRRLVKAAAFIAHLGGRYRWGEVHLVPHKVLSHYEIDLGMLEACWSNDPPDEMMGRSIEASIVDIFNLFGRGADEVEQIYCPLR